MTVTDLDLPRVAVAATGLGHIARGIEAWAIEIVASLRRKGVPAHLFGAVSHTTDIEAVPCLKRTSPMARRIVSLFQNLGGWRYGLGSTYDVEQLTFAMNLWRRIRNDYDILHIQDPLLATVLDRLNRKGLSRPRVILANGTGASVKQLRGLSYVQEILPPAMEAWGEIQGAGPRLFLAPNFIDMNTFSPGDRAAARRELDLPIDAYVVFCAAAIRRYHKRIDYLLQEFAAFRNRFSEKAILVVAGGRESDTDELMELGRTLLGSDVRFMVGVARENMPLLYRAADLFTITSLFETGSIAVIEAIATGLPTICHDTPTLRALGGPSNQYADMTKPGALTRAIADAAQSKSKLEAGIASRTYALQTYSEEVVIEGILKMYRQVMSTPRH